jgi:hypothetical protein
VGKNTRSHQDIVCNRDVASNKGLLGGYSTEKQGLIGEREALPTVRLQYGVLKQIKEIRFLAATFELGGLEGVAKG